MKLPWPDIKVPEYAMGRHGKWSLSRTHGVMPGYFTDAMNDCDVPALRRQEGKNNIVWMSLTKMELESHMPHIAAARGNVVVMGLGMGMYLYNIMHKPNVTHITVVERDASVLKLFYRITDFFEWPGANRVHFVIKNALEYRPDREVHFLYCDFWKKLADQRALRWTQQCVHNVQPQRFGFWTQEFNFSDYLRDNKIGIRHTSAEHYNQFAATVEKGKHSTLIGRNDEAYARLCVMATILQTAVTLATQRDPAVHTVLEVYSELRADYLRIINGELNNV